MFLVYLGVYVLFEIRKKNGSDTIPMNTPFPKAKTNRSIVKTKLLSRRFEK